MEKVFCIGFHKTGTNSIEEALRILGYSVCGVRFDLIPALKENDFAPVKEVVNAYDAFRDNPWPVLFRQLDEMFPGSKFIFTQREENSWLRSVVNHFNTTPSAMLEYVYGKAFPKGNENIYLKIYKDHNAEVISYFRNRPADFLSISLNNTDDSWKELCAFLNKPIPSVPFPKENKGAYTLNQKLMKRFRRLKKALFKKLSFK